MKNLIFVALLTILIFAARGADAQSIPVGSTGLDDYYRRAQLMGKVDSTISFSIRPLSSVAVGSKSVFFPDTTDGPPPRSMRSLGNERISIQLLPFDWQLRSDSRHPYGWNDGAFIPARGFQTLVSGGIYGEYGLLSVQFKPEVIFAENKKFRGFPADLNEVLWWTLYYDFYNKTDLPERFGEESYSRIYPGQSSVRLNIDPLSFGISTENLWWGPGMRNSLIMSNTAPGFVHFTFNTSRPVKTPLGTIEGQFIAGRLEGSGFGPLEPNPIYFVNPIYLPKPDDWRYVSGLSFTWQPKWVPGLFVGLNSSAQVYSKDMTFEDFFPALTPFTKVKSDQAVNRRDKMSSVFFRWLWPEEKAEAYLEYGVNNPSGNLRDFMSGAEHSRAYVFGFRKLLPFGGNEGENLQISVEATQLQQTSANAVRAGASWYVHPYIRHGYTHRGEPLGAGIGPGANLQSLDVSWYKGLKRIGLQLERYAHNKDYYYYAFESKRDWRRPWVDVSAAIRGEWNYHNFIFNARLQAIHSYNYKWYLKEHPGDPYVVNGIDAFSMQAQAGMSYRF